MKLLQEDIEKLGSELRAIRIDGQPIDPLLSTYILIKYLNQLEKFNLIQVVKEWISYFVQLCLSVLKSPAGINLTEGLPLLTFISSRRHLFKMNEEVLNTLNGEANVLLMFQATKTPFTKGAIVPKSNWVNCLSSKDNAEETRVFIQARKVFKKFLKDQKLSAFRLISFSIHLKRQLALFRFFKSEFEKAKPEFILTEHDLYNEIAPIVLAANALNVPTYTQVHGFLNSRFAYTPLSANEIFCWGSFQKKRLMEWGVAEERICITGACQLENDLIDKVEIRLPSFLEKGTKFLVLATNPMTSVLRDGLVSKFLECVNKLPGEWLGIIRIHPSENSQDYEHMIRDSKRVFLCGNEILGYKEVLSIASHVLVFNSAFIIDALVHDIPSAQLKVGEVSLGEINELVDTGVLPSFINVEDLAAHCVAYDSNEHTQNIWSAKRREFISEYCIAYGEDAAKNMTARIRLKSHQYA